MANQNERYESVASSNRDGITRPEQYIRMSPYDGVRVEFERERVYGFRTI